MKIDIKFAGILLAGAVATSGIVLVATSGGDDKPKDPAAGSDPFPGAGGAGNGPSAGATVPGAANPGAGSGGGTPPPQNLPLPEPAKQEPCPSATVTVHDAVSLQQQLNEAKAGDVIQLAPGVYKGQYRTEQSGLADKPIYLCGTAKAVLDGGNADKGYGLQLEGAAYWRLIGFTVRNSQKGVMLDGSSGSVVQGLTVRDTGDEGIHLRKFSTGNTVSYNNIFNTGTRNPRFGEGVYLGTAHKNWGELTQGQPDKSDNNLVAGNKIRATAEAVDIKEGTTGGRVYANVFDGSKLSGDQVNDSWVDAKGNNYVLDANRGSKTVADGFQTHEEYQGWGTGNIFRGNVIDLGGGKGVGINLNSDGNEVACDNKIMGGGKLLNKGNCS
ncbi:right-handed parallel beta-helix repeat-containing protein [Actinomadura barringtoniae]|uniref:Right-handed parallel beta-helix repeat-containing protein n=1 Tax=Actinomadura barringtoniae TaxID=1427535 RepID=A0A939PAM4_9ACTN|nr:NosD domain-containing protein [Actinomadura barringtoniae]MBO2449070.1 right-handed parallel beta-helix repeat-containing protein [Actinomadura barringtoniae]